MFSKRINDNTIIDSFGNEILKFSSESTAHIWSNLFVDILNHIDYAGINVYDFENFIKSCAEEI